MIEQIQDVKLSDLHCENNFFSILKQVSFYCAHVVCKTAWFEVLSNKCKNKGECSRGKIMNIIL